jgi:hypothetical protein
MLSNMKGGFFFFFAACIVFMGAFVFFLVPETKGKSLEAMDEVFGTAYGENEPTVVELRDDWSATDRDIETMGKGARISETSGSTDIVARIEKK